MMEACKKSQSGDENLHRCIICHKALLRDERIPSSSREEIQHFILDKIICASESVVLAVRKSNVDPAMIYRMCSYCNFMVHGCVPLGQKKKSREAVGLIIGHLKTTKDNAMVTKEGSEPLPSTSSSVPFVENAIGMEALSPKEGDLLRRVEHLKRQQKKKDQEGCLDKVKGLKEMDQPRTVTKTGEPTVDEKGRTVKKSSSVLSLPMAASDKRAKPIALKKPMVSPAKVGKRSTFVSPANKPKKTKRSKKSKRDDKDYPYSYKGPEIFGDFRKSQRNVLKEKDAEGDARKTLEKSEESKKQSSQKDSAAIELKTAKRQKLSVEASVQEVSTREQMQIQENRDVVKVNQTRFVRLMNRTQKLRLKLRNLGVNYCWVCGATFPFPPAETLVQHVLTHVGHWSNEEALNGLIMNSRDNKAAKGSGRSTEKREEPLTKSDQPVKKGPKRDESEPAERVIGNSVPETDISHVCDVCDAEFNNNLFVGFHKVAVHGMEDKENRYPVCNKCGQVFLDQSSLDAHMAFHPNGGNSSN